MEQKLRELERQAHWQLQRLRRIRPSQNMMPEGVTPTEMLALKVTTLIIDEGHVPRPGILAEHMHITKPALSQILRSLEDKGYIARQRDKQDSRSVILGVTELGKQKMAEGEAMRVADAHRLAEFIGVKDMETFVYLLDRFATYLEENGEVVDESHHHHHHGPHPFFCKGSEDENEE